MFDPSEIIHCESYYKLCDYCYTGQDDLPSGVVAVDIQSLPDFIRKIEGKNERYVVVCSRSDFGLAIQAEHPAWQDLEKWAGMTAVPALGYSDIIIHTRVDKDKCNINDKYAIRCWSFTSHTFNEIPDNIVHLFLTNSFVNDPRITAIPFGVNGTDGNMEAVNRISNLQANESQRTKLLYVNFQYYTTERFRLAQYYKTQEWATVYESNRTTEEFYNDLLTHKFVLCPEGNGPDCYRMLETLYCGAIPVMPMSDGLYVYYLAKTRVSFTRSLYGLSNTILDKAWEDVQTMEFNYDILRLSYWKGLIDAKRVLL